MIRTTSRQGISYASAIVLVTANNLPLSGATVYATYAAPTSGSVSGKTGTNGKIILKTSTIKNATGTWCFTIIDVTYPGYTYSSTNPTLCESNLKSQTAREEISLDPSISVYPNPYSEEIYFRFIAPVNTRAAITLYDMAGRKLDVVFDEQVQSRNEYIIEYMAGNIITGTLIYCIDLGYVVHRGKLIHR